MQFISFFSFKSAVIMTSWSFEGCVKSILRKVDPKAFCGYKGTINNRWMYKGALLYVVPYIHAHVGGRDIIKRESGQTSKDHFEPVMRHCTIV